MSKKLITLFVLIATLPQIAAAETLLRYKPPQIGAPATRIGGGTRGLSAQKPYVEVLAPQNTALTSQPQPVLYWYLAQSGQQTIEITLIKDGVDQPLLETQLTAADKTGLQKIVLKDYAVSLQPGEEYRWSVAVVNDAEQRSGDLIASATIRYQTPTAPLTTVEQQAEAGYWYDALQQLLDSHSPLVNDLLKQIGLNIPPL